MTAFHRELVETMGKVLEIPCAYQGATERIKIHKGSLWKAGNLMYQMIEEIQKQY